MAWRRIGDKPLSKLIMVYSTGADTSLGLNGIHGTSDTNVRFKPRDYVLV